jgi:hypothetical protein
MIQRMKRTVISLLSLSCGFAATALAQKPVPVRGEPHHHLVFDGDRLRVFRVEVPAHSATMIHEHAVDYFWIAVGASEFVNASVGKPEAPVVAPDGSVHFTRGGFAHLARVDGAAPFRNVTIELPQVQTNPRNLCAPVLPDQPVACPPSMTRASALFSGADALPEFETDQVRVTLLTLAPQARLELARHVHAPLLVAVDDVAGSLPITCPVVDQTKGFGLLARSGNTYRLKGTARCSVQNATRSTVRFLAIEFAPAAR